VRPQSIAAGSVNPEQDLAIHEQREKLDPAKTCLPPELADFLRCGQRGEGGCDLRIANPEQRTGARRFQHHLVAAASQIRKARQDDRVGRGKLWHSRPIIGNLRFDDGVVVVVIGVSEAELQKTASSQALDQHLDFSFGGVSGALERGERQPLAQVLRALDRTSAKFSETDRKAVETRENIFIPSLFERDARVEAGGNNRWREISSMAFSVSAHAGMTSGVGKERSKLAFQ
jgi:hypothetical protein